MERGLGELAQVVAIFVPAQFLDLSRVENSCRNVLGVSNAEVMPLLDEAILAAVFHILDEDIVKLRAMSDFALNSAQDLLGLAIRVSVDAVALGPLS